MGARADKCPECYGNLVRGARKCGCGWVGTGVTAKAECNNCKGTPVYKLVKSAKGNFYWLCYECTPLPARDYVHKLLDAMMAGDTETVARMNAEAVQRDADWRRINAKQLRT